jgi:hypothetical protein
MATLSAWYTNIQRDKESVFEERLKKIDIQKNENNSYYFIHTNTEATIAYASYIEELNFTINKIVEIINKDTTDVKEKVKYCILYIKFTSLINEFNGFHKLNELLLSSIY